MNKRFAYALIAAAALQGAHFTAQASVTVGFAEPKNDASVTSPFKVKLMAKGVKIEPAGEVTAGSGHHHILVDMDSMPTGEEIPFTKKHIHMGKGQDEIEVNLPPGTYKLTMQVANGKHLSMGPNYSKTITVTVK
ncbi:MAG: DUF4399 domain-containing protein [Polaromonas sp.]|nr:DUF4399 domain-containing protein [Polaromonas sp.]